MTQQFIKKIGQYSLFLLVFFRVCVAEVTFDNSLGDITRSADTLSGEITIPVARGDLNGRNLFHSFSTFNINANESVHFVGGTQVDTIISRVTGGDISHINGGLRTTDAHLFFLNPAGIMFGEGAMIDIDGSFHVSTADLIQFDDGSVFAADLSSSDANIRLTSAKPSAFGFFDTDPKAITIKNSDTFKVANHATLSMTGGAIEVTNGSELKAPGGIIQLTSLSGSGFIPINNTPINPDNFDDLGVITISDHSKLDVTGEGHTGGEIFLISGQFTLKGESEINSAFIPNETNYSGPSINIETTDTILIEEESRIVAAVVDLTGSTTPQGSNITIKTPRRLEINNSSISSGGFFGQQGTINLIVGTLQLQNGANITAMTDGKTFGSGGIIQVNASHSIIMSDSTLLSNAGNRRDGGDIVLSTLNISLDNSKIQASASGEGTSGNINITTSDFLNLKNNSEMSAEHTAEGNAGTITINPNIIAIDDTSQIVAKAEAGHGGTINITDGLSLLSINSIISALSNDGLDGTVSVNSPDTDLIATTLVLPENFFKHMSLQSQPCHTQTAGQSSLVINSGQRVPSGPDTFLTSPINSMSIPMFNTLNPGQLDKYCQ